MAKDLGQANGLVQKAVRAQVRAMRTQVDLVRAEDPDGIHDLRVASRRLRAILTAHAKSFPKTKLGKLRKRIQRVTTVLGKPRELDVTLALLERHRQMLHGSERYAINHVIRRVRAERAAQCEAIAQGAAMVASPAFDRGVSGLLNGRYRAKDFRRTAAKHTRKRFAKLVARYEQWRDGRTDASLHQVRIAFKKFRYTCEMYGPLYGRGMKTLIRQLKKAQEALGDWHDYYLLRGYVTDAVANAPPRAAKGMPGLLRAIDARTRTLLGRFTRDAERFFAASSQQEILAFLGSVCEDPAQPDSAEPRPAQAE